MTIQEEIREGMARIICCFAKGNKSCAECEYNTPDTPFPDCFPDIREDTDQLLTYLHSQGVVIKVEGSEELEAAGYAAWEPLIKDDK